MADLTLPDPGDVDGLEDANEASRLLAVDSFRKAYAIAKEPFVETPPQLPQPEADVAKQRRRAQYDAGLAKAKSDMASALQQLVQADVTDAERIGRDGYLKLAALVKTISDTNGALLNIANTTPVATTDLAGLAALLTAHAAFLQALGNLAPVATWPGARPSRSG